MKLPCTAVFALSLALAFHVLGDDTPTGPKDLKTVTIGDKTYSNLHVTSVTDLGIKATWDGGLGTILFSDMPPDLQKKFGYDPNRFKAAENAQAVHDAQSDAVAAAQAKVDQANLQKSDADAARQQEAEFAKKHQPVKPVKYLSGTVVSAVTGGYDISLPPFPVSTGDALTPAYLPKDPYPRIGYNIDVVLKTNAVHTVGEVVITPVVEDGVYTDSTGNHYREFTPVAASP